jgi:hypothetical protein
LSIARAKNNGGYECPIKAPAIVKLPARHAFGMGEGRTLSVVKDMPRKSVVIIIITINIGVRIGGTLRVKVGFAIEDE